MSPQHEAGFAQGGERERVVAYMRGGRPHLGGHSKAGLGRHDRRRRWGPEG